MSSAVGEKVLTLKSQDGGEFSVKASVAVQSVTIKNVVEDDCTSKAIPLSNVDSKTLSLILEYLSAHGDSRLSEKDKKDFDSEFVLRLGMPDLIDIILAANYLEIKNLIGFIAQAIADAIKDDSPEQVRAKFNIENDFTPEEEAALRKENEWAFQ